VDASALDNDLELSSGRARLAEPEQVHPTRTDKEGKTCLAQTGRIASQRTVSASVLHRRREVVRLGRQLVPGTTTCRRAAQ
jgi:hypothetical protein